MSLRPTSAGATRQQPSRPTIIMANPSNSAPKQSFQLIASRQQKKQFDDAVREVIQQRKAANQLQNAVKQAKQLEKQAKQLERQPGNAHVRAKFQDLVRKQAQAVAEGRGSGAVGPSSRGALVRQRGERRQKQAQRPALSSSLITSGPSGNRGLDWATLAQRYRSDQQLRQQCAAPPHGRRLNEPGESAVEDDGGGGRTVASRRHSITPKQVSPTLAAFYETRRSSDGFLPERRPSMNRSSSFKSTLNDRQIKDIPNFPSPLVTSPSKTASSQLMKTLEGSSSHMECSRHPGISAVNVNSIGCGDRKVRNKLAQKLQTSSLGGIDGGALGELSFVSGRILGDGDLSGQKLGEKSGDDLREKGGDHYLGESRGHMPKYNRKISYGDTQMIAVNQPEGNFTIGGKEGTINGGEGGHDPEKIPQMQKRNTFINSRHGTTSVAEQTRRRYELRERKTRKGDRGGIVATGRESSGVGLGLNVVMTAAHTKNDNENPTHELANEEKSFGNNQAKNMLDISSIKLEDLVPTRRPTVSRDNSEREGMKVLNESGRGQGVEGTNFRENAEEEVLARRQSHELISHLKRQEAVLEPVIAGFTRRGSEADRELESDFGRFLEFCTAGMEQEEAANFRTKALGAQGKQVSASSSLSYKTACSRDGSSSPSRTIDDMDEHADVQQDVMSSCPRSQFVLLKSKAKSNSGATGQTQGTSSSSIFSSNNSVTENATVSGKDISSFDIIKEVKEEEKDFGSSFGASDFRELPSGDSLAVGSGVGSGDAVVTPPESSNYKKRRNGRIKRLKKGIRKSLMGTKGIKDGGGRGDEFSEIESQGGSISVEQQERVSRHLRRESSNRSMTSAFSMFSAFTGASDASSRASSKGRWSRFLPKARSGMRKASSMRDVSSTRSLGGAAPGSRRILVQRDASAFSTISQMSCHSGMDDSSNSSALTGQFTDFYDNQDHVRAVSSLLSSKSASGKSLVTNLATVKEPAHEGEQKYDEDYHCMYEQCQQQHKSGAATFVCDDSLRSEGSRKLFYRHPSHNHLLVHMLPSQLYPESPGWQCDECSQETFDPNTLAYVSTEKNFLLCESCFTKSGCSASG